MRHRYGLGGPKVSKLRTGICRAPVLDAINELDRVEFSEDRLPIVIDGWRVWQCLGALWSEQVGGSQFSSHSPPLEIQKAGLCCGVA